jgi:UDP-3-O-[3-hydroxymyristoyl] glucosamine N-acyltransferase
MMQPTGACSAALPAEPRPTQSMQAAARSASASTVMEHPGFFERAGPFSLATLAERLGCEPAAGHDLSQLITDIRPLDTAGAGHLSFVDNRKYLVQLQASRASACLVAPAFASRVPATTVPMLLRGPYRGFAQALAIFYPEAMRPKTAMSEASDPLIHPTARIEPGVRIEAGAVIALPLAVTAMWAPTPL